ncbi:hypothetical protein M2281_001187 [Mesorhizobium soli]|jgi:hypothetical protein|uniref:hypothetical protein n=1 Tax=Pseudaminobacter soli (ex Li et al. 2025) TaxID=1295366 RepID=UPI002475D41F|nr:hypothetical protein [Mesorhizobium soli]MDH6230615.1 hypothetical protein [Mesorhizobium soli]
MTLLNRITTYAIALREFIAPTYRPERHYMRGPGPACERRRSTTTATPKNRATALDARPSFQ